MVDKYLPIYVMVHLSAYSLRISLGSRGRGEAKGESENICMVILGSSWPTQALGLSSEAEQACAPLAKCLPKTREDQATTKAGEILLTTSKPRIWSLSSCPHLRDTLFCPCSCEFILCFYHPFFVLEPQPQSIGHHAS